MKRFWNGDFLVQKESTGILTRKFFSLMFAIALFISFSACSGTDKAGNGSSASEEEFFVQEEYAYTEKDAQNFVQWNLDIIYKGIISDEGAESFGITQEDVENFHINEILMESEDIVTLVGGDKYFENIHERCFNIVKSVYLKTDYTVGEAIKTGDKSFEVPVEVCAFNWMGYFESEIAEALEKLFEEYPEMADENIPEDKYEKYEKLFAEKILEILEKSPDNAEYSEPEILTVIVVQLEDGTWDITEESFNNLISEILK